MLLADKDKTMSLRTDDNVVDETSLSASVEALAEYSVEHGEEREAYRCRYGR